MQKLLVISSFFLGVFIVSCSNPSAKVTNAIKPFEDISIISYNFISDTSQIKILIKDKISPRGLPFQARDLLNHFIRITLKNNTTDTIFFSNPTGNISSSIDSVILSYCPVSLYSVDSIKWKPPSLVSDYYPNFLDAVLTNQTVTRFLYVQPYENSKYFNINMHYQVNDSVKSQSIILKL